MGFKRSVKLTAYVVAVLSAGTAFNGQTAFGKVSIQCPGGPKASSTIQADGSELVELTDIKVNDRVYISIRNTGTKDLHVRSSTPGADQPTFDPLTTGDTIGPGVTTAHVFTAKLADAVADIDVHMESTSNPPTSDHHGTFTATCMRPTVSGSLSLTPSPIKIGQSLLVAVNDVDFNTDKTSKQTVNVAVRNQTSGESELLVLTETGNDTGQFAGALPTEFGNTKGTSNNGVLWIENGQTVEASYDDLGVARSATVNVQGSTGGTIGFEPSVAFNVNQMLTVRVTDADHNVDQALRETIVAIVENAVFHERETISLVETAVNSGVFEGKLPTALANAKGQDGDGVLNVFPHHQIGAQYDDFGVTRTSNWLSAQGGVDGVLTVPPTLEAGANLLVRVTDSDANNNPTSANKVWVIITNSVTGEKEEVQLSETGVNTGILEGVLATTLGAGTNGDNNHTMSVQGGQKLQVDYLDPFTTDGDQMKHVTADTTVVGESAVVVSAHVDHRNASTVGVILKYMIEVHNEGLVSIPSPGLSGTLTQGTDSLSPLTSPILTIKTGNNDPNFDPHETWVYEATYRVEQRNFDEVNGSDIVFAISFAGQTAEMRTSLSQKKGFEIHKYVDRSNISAAQALTYRIEVKNTGNVTLTDGVLEDVVTRVGGDVLKAKEQLNPTGGDGDGDGQLDVGETWIYGTAYTVTPGDIANGATIVNTATFKPKEVDTSRLARVETTIGVAPALSVAVAVDKKQVDVSGIILTYEIVVTNSGGVALNSVSLTDGLTQDASGGVLPLSGATSVSKGNGDDVLDPDEKWTYSATYTVRQAEIDNGADIVYTVNVDTSETEAVTKTTATQVNRQPGFTVAQSGYSDSISGPETLTYAIAVTNTGNTTLTDIAIEDQLTQLGGATQNLTATDLEGDLDTDSKLDVGEVWTYSISYAVSAQDIQNGGPLVNTAKVSTGTGNNLSSRIARAETKIVTTVNVAIEQTVTESTFDKTGDVLHYSIVIENTGSTKLTGVVVSSETSANIVCPNNELTPQEKMVCEADYAVRQSDVDGGTVNMIFTVDTDQTEPRTGGQGAVSRANQTALLEVTKTTNPTSFSKPGDILTFNYTITNTGNTTLVSISLNDTLIGDVPQCSVNRLAPGEHKPCSTQYVVTQADIDAGGVTSTATAHATGDLSGPASGTDTMVILFRDGPSEAEVQDKFKNLTGAFMARRIDRILENEPDSSRLKNRASGGQQQAGLVANLQGNGSNLDGSFSLSAQGMRSRILQLDGQTLPAVGEGGLIERFDIWAEGRFNSLKNADDKDKSEGQFGILHTGFDYRVSDDILLGVMASMDWMTETREEVDGKVKGDGWMVGPYLSARLSENLYFDGRVGWGRSDNTAKQEIMGVDFEGDFETERWLAKATLSGVWEFDQLIVSPEIGIAYIEEKQKSYDVQNGSDSVKVDGQTVSVGRLNVAQEIGYRYLLEGTELLPYLKASLHWDFKQAETFILLDDSESLGEVRGGGEVGLRMRSDGGIAGSLAVSYDGLFSDDMEAFGVKGGISIPFQ